MRRIRFGLKSLLLLMTLVAVAAAMWGKIIQPYRAQRASLDWVLRTRPAVNTQVLASGLQVTSPFVVRAAIGNSFERWLVMTFAGADAYVDVVEVDLRSAKLADDAPGHLRALRKCEKITLDRTQADDRALAALEGFPQLTSLSLAYTPITDTGLASLATLPRLEHLLITGTPITDAGLAELAKCKSLRSVYMRWTKATPAGVDALRAALPECEVYFHELPRE